MTPRATMSTRVLETIDIITAILSTPGFWSTSLARPHALRDRRVAADLAVVGRLAAVGADRVEQRQRAAAGADHEPEVAVELGHVAGHAAVVLGVDRLAGELERRRLARLARLLVADAELVQQRLLARAGLVLHVHVRVERDERAVLELAERVDLGQRHVVLDEQPRQPGEDRGRAGSAREPVTPIEAITSLACEVGERPRGREVPRGRRGRGAARRPPRCRCRPCRRRASPGCLRIPSQTTPA